MLIMSRYSVVSDMSTQILILLNHVDHAHEVRHAFPKRGLRILVVEANVLNT